MAAGRRPSPGAASSGPAAIRVLAMLGAGRRTVGRARVPERVGHDFVLDDTRIIQDNVRIRSAANIPALFASSWGQSGTNALYGRWRLPHTRSTTRFTACGLRDTTAVNVALHASVSLLCSASCAASAVLPAAGIAAIVYRPSTRCTPKR